MSYVTDGINYANPDSGCEKASEYLGYQSSCLECPFDTCVLDESAREALVARRAKRNAEISRLCRQGKSRVSIAQRFNLKKNTIDWILCHKC